MYIYIYIYIHLAEFLIVAEVMSVETTTKAKKRPMLRQSTVPPMLEGIVASIP